MTFGKPESALSSWQAVVLTLFSCRPTWMKTMLVWTPNPTQIQKTIFSVLHFIKLGALLQSAYRPHLLNKHIDLV